jgi:redox-sensitive bicupin YhaK (pirin superfamily)
MPNPRSRLAVVTIIRADERFRTSQPGIASWHVLSAGPHYDPERVRMGPLIGIDEHVLAPGAHFAEHAHRGVDVVSWVCSGTLAHNGATSLLVRPGDVLVQRAGTGIRHDEGNPSTFEPLRLVQMTLLSSSDIEPATELTAAPVALDAATFVAGPAGPAYVYVVSGSWRDLAPGDFAYVAEPPEGEGELLSWCVRSDS